MRVRLVSCWQKYSTLIENKHDKALEQSMSRTSDKTMGHEY